MREILEEVRAVGSVAFEANNESLKRYHASVAVVLAALDRELERGDLSEERRSEISATMVDLVDRMGEKDNENKRFLAAMAQEHLKAGVAVAGVLTVGVVAVFAGSEGVKSVAKMIPQNARRIIS